MVLLLNIEKQIYKILYVTTDQICEKKAMEIEEKMDTSKVSRKREKRQ